jgi:hypothetical protein
MLGTASSEASDAPDGCTCRVSSGSVGMVEGCPQLLGLIEIRARFQPANWMSDTWLQFAI